MVNQTTEINPLSGSGLINRTIIMENYTQRVKQLQTSLVLSDSDNGSELSIYV
jgi:hypothetical protein